MCSEEGLGWAGTSTELAKAFCVTELRSSCSAPEKSTLERQVIVETESVGFNQKADILEKRWTCIPNPTPKILLSPESF